MTRNELRALIALRLGNRTDLDDRIDAEIQLAQADLEGEAWLPWFLLTQTTTLQTDAVNTDRVDLSTDLPDFILPHEESNWEWQDSTGAWIPIEKRYDLREQQYVDSRVFDESTPAIYTLVGSTLILYPDPGAQLTLRGWYFSKADTLSSDIENGWTKYAPELLASLTCAKLAPLLQMGDMVNVYAGMYNTALARLQQMDEARRASATNLVMQYGNGGT